MTDINAVQKTVLKKISKFTQVATGDLDGRTIRALVHRDFAKIVANKKGEFVKITAKGKKAIN
jgi:predicted transcriptional regulator